MMSCWRLGPESRPPFDQLEKKISIILDNEVMKHYVSLNETYLLANTSHFKSREIDFTALLGIPDIQSPPIPKNVVRSSLSRNTAFYENLSFNYNHSLEHKEK